MRNPNEAVDHPPHYFPGKHEVIDVIEAWGLGFSLGNVVKYIARHNLKGTPLEDLQKANWYLQHAISQHGGKFANPEYAKDLEAELARAKLDVVAERHNVKTSDEIAEGLRQELAAAREAMLQMSRVSLSAAGDGLAGHAAQLETALKEARAELDGATQALAAAKTERDAARRALAEAQHEVEALRKVRAVPF